MKNNFPLRPQFVYKMHGMRGRRGMLAAIIHLGREQEGQDEIRSPDLLCWSCPAPGKPELVQVQ